MFENHTSLNAFQPLSPVTSTFKVCVTMASLRSFYKHGKAILFISLAIISKDIYRKIEVNRAVFFQKNWGTVVLGTRAT